MKTGDAYMFGQKELEDILHETGFEQTEWNKIHPLMYMAVARKPVGY